MYTFPPQMTINATLCFHSAPRFATRTLAHVLDSLVRVSRRVDQRRSASITNPPHDGLAPQSNKTSTHRHRFPIPTCMPTTVTQLPRPCGHGLIGSSALACIAGILRSRREDTAVKPASQAHSLIPISYTHGADAGSLPKLNA